MKISKKFTILIGGAVGSPLILIILSLICMKRISGSADPSSIFFGSAVLMVIAGLLLAGGAAMFVLRLKREIVSPLRELESVASAIARGDLRQTIRYSSENEFGAASGSINKTLQQLNEYEAYITEIADTLDEIASGNLMFKLKQKYDGDFAKIRNGFDMLSRSLNGTLAEVEHCSDSIAQGAEQMSDNAQDFSQGSAEQAQSIEQLSDKIGEITHHIQETALHAENAQKAAEKAGEEMEISNQEMRNMVTAMNDISSSSDAISKIIKTIEDIAFQTNILALNAAVEAARAGSAGKGFAVVADEVRNLANKSAEAAQETNALIGSSLQAVQNGTQIADRTAQSLTAVTEQSIILMGLIKKISHAAAEQASAITLVGEGIEQISTVTQRVSSAAETSAASSEELAAQGQILRELLSNFQIDKNATLTADTLTATSRFDKGIHSRTEEKKPVIHTYVPEAHINEEPPAAVFEKPKTVIRPEAYAQSSEPAAAPAPVAERKKAASADSYEKTDNPPEFQSRKTVTDEYLPDDVDSKY
ncbi:MAG: methyl-accepting chemotaxis protein [Anaerovoracaceae bacterium]